MDKKKLTSLIKQIADCRGVSGSEEPVAQLCRDIMSRYTCDAEIKNGNVLAHFGSRSPEKPQKDLLSKFEASLGENNYNKRKSFFDKVKKILNSDI